MSHDEAIEEFKKLVSQYGLKWTSKVPAEAWTKMNEIVAVTSEDDRRRAAVSEIYRRD